MRLSQYVFLLFVLLGCVKEDIDEPEPLKEIPEMPETPSSGLIRNSFYSNDGIFSIDYIETKKNRYGKNTIDILLIGFEKSSNSRYRMDMTFSGDEIRAGVYKVYSRTYDTTSVREGEVLINADNGYIREDDEGSYFLTIELSSDGLYVFDLGLVNIYAPEGKSRWVSMFAKFNFQKSSVLLIDPDVGEIYRTPTRINDEYIYLGGNYFTNYRLDRFKDNVITEVMIRMNYFPSFLTEIEVHTLKRLIESTDDEKQISLSVCYNDGIYFPIVGSTIRVKPIDRSTMCLEYENVLMDNSSSLKSDTIRVSGALYYSY